ncbi:fimbria/pilus outer membrane usher protein [Serratia fonticola]|uniref:fimbria/pilus outer membrane usher protein n=1 Tax=Serratia fonticola TaxID=47917 RepID=UPI00217996A6|nr:fimbria/pilus outer membrane usher protein [Serratia fonticola]CAI2026541.1 Outer membrane usher protein fimD precursor [Serratia fonticola]CAI2029415.1 Outer membrane usher protein fimD precursor [Serratia fonticola]CAI2032327.1 Outer membrane usher protein fimD precursor [Serratia fonticola]HBE9182014.1 fimbrial biogenesis outer membrane usher protein [Serratia fonticola]
MKQRVQARQRPSPRVSRLAYFIAAQLTLLGGVSFSAQARDYFNPALLELDNPQQGKTDLTVFEDGATQAPGTYRVDIYVNNQQFETHDIEFRMQKGEDGADSLQPCLSVAQLNAMGVKTDLFPGLGDDEAKCADLSAIPQASTEFRFSAQQLLLSIPQAAMVQQARGYVPESQWDNGIPALLLNYSLSGANTYARNGDSSNSNSQFANLRPGINVGPWRLRNYTTWNRDSHGQDKWNTIYTYLARDITSLKSQLVLGDSSSPSDVFDSVPFRGAQLASDDDMIPDSLKGYAPVVRGIARTNAQVTIRQNGYVIYQSFVAPGAFEINDMYPTGGSGDLLVTIKEADGSEQQLVVPFASLPVLQREGRLKYAVTGGQYRSYDSSVDATTFGQGSAIYGLPHGFTAYGGSQFANPYRSLALGVGKNLGDFGAFSADVTQAWSTMQDRTEQDGQSWRLRYSKNIVQTGTNFAIAGYRYSTDGYYSLQEVLDTYRDQNSQTLVERRRNRSEVTMSQNLWEGAGSLSLSWVSEDYWNSDRTLRSIGAGYNNSWNGISYGLNYSYNENSTVNGGASGRVYDRDQVLAFNVSVPLSRWLGNTYASYNLNTSQKGGTTNTVGVNGSALAGNNLNWSAQQGYGSQGVGNSGNLNANYRGTYAEVSSGYAYDSNSQRLNYGLQGGIIAHGDGVTFGQSMGETIALVQAPGANGVGVSGQTGVKTDWRGYAIVPYAAPYRKSQIQLNTETLPDNVDLALTHQTVIPTRGAVVKASYQTNVGQRVLMTLLRQGGAPVPFGATVSDPAQQTAQGFIVGDGGQVYLTGMAESGTLQVKWGTGVDQQCQVSYSLTKQTTINTGIQTLNGQCL